MYIHVQILFLVFDLKVIGMSLSTYLFYLLVLSEEKYCTAKHLHARLW